MKVTAFVPIKLNSQRLPGKMLLTLGNKKLYLHVFDTLRKVPSIDEIYCYCSDPVVSQDLPSDVLFLKRNIEVDKMEGMDIYNSFASLVESDIYVLAHATSPFVKYDSFSRGLTSVLSGQYDSACSVSRLRTYCWHNDKPINFTRNKISKTQDLHPVFYETSGFYIFTKQTLNEGQRHGKKIFMTEVDKIEAIDIDELQDFTIANAIASITTSQ